MNGFRISARSKLYGAWKTQSASAGIPRSSIFWSDSESWRRASTFRLYLGFPIVLDPRRSIAARVAIFGLLVSRVTPSFPGSKTHMNAAWSVVCGGAVVRKFVMMTIGIVDVKFVVV